MPEPRRQASRGRDVRLVVGFLCLCVNGYLIWTKAHEVPSVPLTTNDLILHGLFLGAALLLMDPVRALEVLGRVRLPFTGSKP